MTVTEEKNRTPNDEQSTTKAGTSRLGSVRKCVRDCDWTCDKQYKVRDKEIYYVSVDKMKDNIRSVEDAADVSIVSEITDIHMLPDGADRKTGDPVQRAMATISFRIVDNDTLEVIDSWSGYGLGQSMDGKEIEFAKSYAYKCFATHHNISNTDSESDAVPAGPDGYTSPADRLAIVNRLAKAAVPLSAPNEPEPAVTQTVKPLTPSDPMTQSTLSRFVELKSIAQIKRSAIPPESRTEWTEIYNCNSETRARGWIEKYGHMIEGSE